MENKLDKIDVLLSCLADCGNLYFHSEGVYYSFDDKSLILSWKTGEDSGGNCWGDEPKYIPSNQKEPDFSVLDNLLLAIEPDLKLKTYKKIMNTVKFYDSSNHEYYNNGCYYNNKSISKENIFNILMEDGIILSEQKTEDLILLFTNKLHKNENVPKF